jgi:ABC-2 type transport system ATP-binding protein
LGERLVRNEEASGSIPLSSTISGADVSASRFWRISRSLARVARLANVLKCFFRLFRLDLPIAWARGGASMHGTGSDDALRIRGLKKRYERPAVDGLDLTIRRGEFYMLLGPNGAGKTTTLRMVSGLLRPDEGSIAVFGVDVLAEPVAAKRMMGWLSDEPMIYDKLTPLEYLEFVSGLWGVETTIAESRARQLLSWLGLGAHANERCEGFSRGMRQKVALAGALVHEPSLVILDEPLTGLDAASARLVKNVLTERVKAGNTVIMTTHILEIAERMADRIGVIANGRLIAEGTLEELRREIGKGDSTLEEIFLSIVEEDGSET